MHDCVPSKESPTHVPVNGQSVLAEQEMVSSCSHALTHAEGGGVAGGGVVDGAGDDDGAGVDFGFIVMGVIAA